MTKETINFLKHIYSESVPDIANIFVAEAEGDKETIRKYLTSVRDYVDKLIYESTKDSKDTEAH